MNDFTTRDAVCWILNKMGFKKLADDASKSDSNLDVYIRYIKYVDKNYSSVREFINYYL